MQITVFYVESIFPDGGAFISLEAPNLENEEDYIISSIAAECVADVLQLIDAVYCEAVECEHLDSVLLTLIKCWSVEK